MVLSVMSPASLPDVCINESVTFDSVTKPLSSEVVTTVAEVAIVSLAVTKKLAS